ncbi:MAG: pectin acetylesterase-family hydrolase [Bacteriovoracaceae bacterium]
MKFLFLLFIVVNSAFAFSPEPREVYHQDKGWWEVFPGGKTTCAYGAPYSFYFKEGDPTKLIIDFVGGGACWSEKSCRRAAFRNNNNPMEGEVKGANGIYLKDNEKNPVGDWSHLVVGYCTGDLHWGDNVVSFGEGEKEFKIHFKGAINARAALSWIFERVKRPEKVLITGTSAGSYASVYWAPTIIERYKKTAFTISQMGDSGAGVITQKFFQDSFSNWNALKNIPTWIPGLSDFQTNWMDKDLSDIYKAVGDHYPDYTFSQFNFSHDQGQIFFLELMKEEEAEKSDDIDIDELFYKTLSKSNLHLTHNLSNYTFFTAAGLEHSFIPSKEYYSLVNEGVSFLEWFTHLTNGGTPAPVECQNCEDQID